MELGTWTQIYNELQGQYVGCAIRNDCLIEAVQGTDQTAKSEQCITKETTVLPAKEANR